MVARNLIRIQMQIDYVNMWARKINIKFSMENWKILTKM